MVEQVTSGARLVGHPRRGAAALRPATDVAEKSRLVVGVGGNIYAGPNMPLHEDPSRRGPSNSGKATDFHDGSGTARTRSVN